MKKILVLGAMLMHVPLIKRLKERGFYVITCDYLASSIGHRFADKASLVSTTDLDAVLKLALDENVDGIMTYNSDPAAYTAAYVANKLGLSGNPASSVDIMSNKAKFRKFLKKMGLNTPNFIVVNSYSDIEFNFLKIQFPSIVKPVDSSGSKGVKRVDNLQELITAYKEALNYSRSKKVIIEEYIGLQGPQIHGDAFVENGVIKFHCLGDHHFDNFIKGNVPIATSFPSSHTKDVIARVIEYVQEFLSAVKFVNGGINIEARLNPKNNEVYLIEVGPRNGGNFTPKVIEYHTGFNFLDAAIDACLGNSTNSKDRTSSYYFHSYLVLTSNNAGEFEGISFHPDIEKNVIDSYIYKRRGERIEPFDGANQAIGVLLLRYETREEMENIISHSNQYYEVLFS